jgi:hypothetical protein
MADTEYTISNDLLKIKTAKFTESPTVNDIPIATTDITTDLLSRVTNIESGNIGNIILSNLATKTEVNNVLKIAEAAIPKSRLNFLDTRGMVNANLDAYPDYTLSSTSGMAVNLNYVSSATYSWYSFECNGIMAVLRFALGLKETSDSKVMIAKIRNEAKPYISRNDAIIIPVMSSSYTIHTGFTLTLDTNGCIWANRIPSGVTSLYTISPITWLVKPT